MDPRTAAPRGPDPDAVEFIRFCYRRRRVGWPELYDEMCAVAARGQFRGYGPDDLSALGIGFGLFDLPALATLASSVVAEERARRRAVTVTLVGEVAASEAAEAPSVAIAPAAVLAADVEAHMLGAGLGPEPSDDPGSSSGPEPRIRFAMRPVRA